MKTLTLRLRKAYREGNCSFGDAYVGRCPICQSQLFVSPSEMKERKMSDHNLCPHVDGIRKDGKLTIRPKMSVVAFGSRVRVNGRVLPYSMNQLINELERITEEESVYDWIRYPDWAPRQRFDAIKTEAWRVYNADPKRWEAQAKVRNEENERAELARLKAKYEEAKS